MTELDIINSVKDTLYKNLSYTKQDYNAIIGEIIDLFRGSATGDRLTTKWNNVSEADIMFIFMSLLAAHKDILNYMIDYRTLESYMSTAKERASVVRIANSFGYKIPSFKAAKATLEVDSISGSGSELIVENFTSFRDSSNNIWTYIDIENGPAKLLSITIPENIIDVYQGTPVSIEINPEHFDSKSRTYIISNQQVAIGNNANIDGCSIMYATKTGESDILFKEVENLYTYNGSDNYVYELNVDPQGITYIRLPKALNLADLSGYTLTFKYIITNGSGISYCDSIETSLSPDSVEPKTYYDIVLEPTEFVAGSNAATIDDIRENFKSYYASASSLVTLNDYKNFILNIQKKVLGITKCLVIDKQSDTLYEAGDPLIDNLSIAIYVLKANNALVTETAELTEELNKYRISGISLYINEASISGVTGSVLEEVPVFVELEGLNSELLAVKNTIKQLISDYINEKQIGEAITVEELSDLLSNNNYSKYYNAIRLRKTSDPTPATAEEIELEYYQYSTCDTDSVTDKII